MIFSARAPCSFFVALLLLLLVLNFESVADAAAVRCATSDCSDVVGDGLVKDSKAHSSRFTEAHHDDLLEQQRINRIKLGLKHDNNNNADL